MLAAGMTIGDVAAGNEPSTGHRQGAAQASVQEAGHLASGGSGRGWCCPCRPCHRGADRALSGAGQWASSGFPFFPLLLPYSGLHSPWFPLPPLWGATDGTRGHLGVKILGLIRGLH